MYGKSEKEIDSLVRTVKIFCSDIGMEFAVSKCAALAMKGGKRAHSNGKELPDEEFISETGDGGYKYVEYVGIEVQTKRSTAHIAMFFECSLKL